jgi:hypothetical protein
MTLFAYVVGFAHTNKIVTVVIVPYSHRFTAPKFTSLRPTRVLQTLTWMPGTDLTIALRHETGLLQYTGKPVKGITRSAVFLNSLDHENCPAGHA